MTPTSRKPDKGRQVILDYLHQEIIGPSDLSRAKPLNISPETPTFEDAESASGPWYEVNSGQEILSGIRPRQRYGAGILYSVENNEVDEPIDDFDASESTMEEIESNDDEIVVEEVIETNDEIQPDENEIESRTNRLPSSMGVSCYLVIDQQNPSIRVKVKGGLYEPFQIIAKYRKIQSETWYVRREFQKICILDLGNLSNLSKPKMIDLSVVEETESPLKIEVHALIRPWGDKRFLVTFSVVNKTKSHGNSSLLFQTEFTILPDKCSLLPYPESSIRTSQVESETYRAKARLDDLSTDLLFRNYPNYAIGHNCSVDWQEINKKVESIQASCFPTYEAPSITAQISYANGKMPVLSMLKFSKQSEKEFVLREMSELIDEYENWIDKQTKYFVDSNESQKYLEAFENNVKECKDAVRRMRKGINLLAKDSQVYEAFRMANEAILKQQIRSKLTRRSSYVGDDGRLKVDGETPSPKLDDFFENKWRPFQIAFILNVLESIANKESEDRDIVDLIFFPTGGGKTEAYLGVIAFTIILKRLRNPEDDGTTVIMRYTLRLLTTQQFLRAASLICALEEMRSVNPKVLGVTAISIGAWLGGGVTPNRREDARHKLAKMTDRPKKRSRKAENPFLVLQCPWCAAELGQVSSRNSENLRRKPAGYVETLTTPRTVQFRCPDLKCEFSTGIPLYVIDEDVYRHQPSLIIGTVDKFAQMSWKSRAQSIFGRNSDGVLDKSPPSLIIQDEFHLISGPLGSMVGHYETVVEELCTENLKERRVLPKIISSTATIRRFWAQANAVYGRERVSLFPPPLLDISDSFFAVWNWKNDSGELSPGRLYVGVFAPGLGSVRSAQVRAGAALSAAPLLCDEESRDPWWTNLWFFNSLKELGNTIALFQIDIRNYLRRLRTRDLLPEERFLKEPLELTSRRKNSEIPEILQQLSNKYPPTKGHVVWDNCLASNIIEVGIDIDRLSLMTVVSQPKSTSQYIQVTGRVGRNTEERPGLVVVIYAFGRPRDLSHFEHFRSYHERLYSQVEPTSVTPFALPVVRRALRGALTALVRMNSPENSKPNEISESVILKYGQVFSDRIKKINGISEDERKFLNSEITSAVKEYVLWDRSDWEGDDGLLQSHGVDLDIPDFTWKIPSSMRNVDATVGLMVTTLYLAEGENY